MTMSLLAGSAAALVVVSALSLPAGAAGGPGALPSSAVDAAFRSALRETAESMARRRGFGSLPAPPFELVDDDALRVARASAEHASAAERAAREARGALHALLGMGAPLSLPSPSPSPSLSVSSLLPPSPPSEPVSPAGVDAAIWLGLYQPVTGKVLVSISPDSGGDPIPLWHDVALALLDRRFHIQAFVNGRGAPVSMREALAARSVQRSPPKRPRIAVTPLDPDDLDAALARQGLVEGDALVQALDQELPAGLPTPQGLALAVTQAARAAASMPPAEAVAVDPRQVPDAAAAAAAATAASGPASGSLDRARRLFPQTVGLTFVAQARAREPWKTIDQIWAAPPESSEQMLHPEKYARRERPDARPDPVASRLPPLTAVTGWRARAQDTLGELGVQVFLQRASDEYHAERAATGWGGDRAILLESASGAARAAVWITTWDDETDARDFAEQASAVLVALAESTDASFASVVVPVPSVPSSPSAIGALDVRPGRAAAPEPWLRLRLTDRHGRQYAMETGPRTVGLLFAAPDDGGVAILHQMVTAVIGTTPGDARRRRGAAGPDIR